MIFYLITRFSSSCKFSRTTYQREIAKYPARRPVSEA